MPSSSRWCPRVAERVTRLWRMQGRNELLALLMIVAGLQFLPARIPAGIYGIGVVSGSLLALQGMGLVLIYRSNRIINFAQASLALSAALLFSTAVQYRTLLRPLDAVCPSDCANNPVFVQLDYWLSLLLVLAFVVLLGWLSYFLVVRRFAEAPRLILTVATIFIGYTVLGISEQLVPLLIPPEVLEQQGVPPGAQPATLPFDLSRRVGSVTFHTVDAVTVFVVLACLAALLIYLRRSTAGSAIRAAADDPDRAATLGINVSEITGRVWIISSALSAVAGVLSAMAHGAIGAGGSGDEVRMLAAAVLAAMTSLPLVVLASIVLGILEQGIQVAFGSTIFLDGTLFILIGALLLLQSRGRARAEQAMSGAWRAAGEVRPTPRELRSLPVVRNWMQALIAGAAIVLVGLPWITSPSQTTLAAAVMIYAIIGLSLLVLTGWAGQISLGQVAFAAIGGYVAAVSHLPFAVGLLAGGLAGAAAALLIGIPALRLRGLQLAVITLAFHQAVVSIGLNPAFLGRYLPLQLVRPSLGGIGFDDQRVFYYFVLAMTTLIGVAVWGLRRTRTARALIAARDNEQAAQVFGINLVRARMGAFAVSGFLAAFAGVLLAYHQYGVQAVAFNVPLSRTVFLYSVIGGLGTLLGPLIGFAYYGVPLLFQLPGLVPLLLAGPGGLLLLLLARGGLAQILFDLRDSWLRKVARRHRIIVPTLVSDWASEGLERARLAPKTRPGGGLAYVAERYHLPLQWALDGVGVLHRNGGGGGSSAPPAEVELS